MSLSEEALEDSRKQKEPLKELKALLAVSRSLWGLGKLDNSLEFIDTAMTLFNTVTKNNEVRKINSSFLDLKGMIQNDKGEFPSAHKLCDDGLKIRIELEEKYDIGNSLNSLGVIYANQGELSKSLDFFKRSLKIKEEIGNKQDISYSINNIASIHYYQGDYDLSLQMNKKVLQIHQDLGNKLDMASTYNNIGVDYHATGNLDLALEHYEKSLALYEQIGNKQSVAMSISNIGGIYENQSKFDLAFEYYKKSLGIRQDIGNTLEISDSLFALISLSLEMKESEQAQIYMNQLENIKENQENKLIHLSYNLSKALILKKQSRAKDKLEAHILFEKIIEDEILDYQMTIFAMVNLCELLIEELRSYGSEEVIQEIKQITDKLLTVAKEQNSNSTLAETYLLQAKLELLVGDLEVAKLLMNQALFTAEEKGLMQLAMKISEEYDSFLERIDLWESLIEQGASITERLEQLNLQDQMLRLLQKKWDKVVISPEVPITLMLISIGGLILYSKTFVMDSQIDENLFSNFITAINTFSVESFATKGSIEKIKHQEYTIALKRKNKITFAYVFKGQLFPAKQKLNKFMDQISSSKELWEELTTMTPVLNTPTQKKIDKITSTIFFT